MANSTLCYFECRLEHSAELIVVEGKHAANAVNRARDKSNQAVLAMQGKVPNVAKHSLQQQIDKNEHVRQLAFYLESWAQATEPPVHRFTQVMILSDPDADGLHAAMLLITLLAEACPNLVREGQLLLCRSPLFLMSIDEHTDIPVYSEAEMKRYREQEGLNLKRVQRIKGVASLPLAVLHRTCIDPYSRTASPLSETDCAAVKHRLR